MLQEPDLTVERANNELQMRTQTAIDLWGIDNTSWNLDLKAGKITFTNEEKALVVTAPVQLVGTYDTVNGTWLWGWDHPSVPQPLGEHARRVREFGERYELETLVTRTFETSEEQAWIFTALACHLGGAQGGYRCPSGPTLVFTTFGTVTLQHKG